MPDLITNTDIAPTAGILGTQIADYTIQTRNIAPQAILALQIQDGDVFKIISKGSTTFDVTGTTANILVPHGLDYAPIVFATVDASFNTVAQGLTPAPSLVLGTNSSVGNNYVVSAFCQIRGSDTTNIKFFVGVLTGIRYNGTIYYYILQESATPS